MLEEELEQAKEQMLAGDPDLAAKIVGKGDVGFGDRETRARLSRCRG